MIEQSTLSLDSAFPAAFSLHIDKRRALLSAAFEVMLLVTAKQPALPIDRKKGKLAQKDAMFGPQTGSGFGVRVGLALLAGA